MQRQQPRGLCLGYVVTSGRHPRASFDVQCALQAVCVQQRLTANSLAHVSAAPWPLPCGQALHYPLATFERTYVLHVRLFAPSSFCTDHGVCNKIQEQTCLQECKPRYASFARTSMLAAGPGCCSEPLGLFALSSCPPLPLLHSPSPSFKPCMAHTITQLYGGTLGHLVVHGVTLFGTPATQPKAANTLAHTHMHAVTL